MKVTNILKISMILGAAALASACSDSASDPGTESKADLNPPGTLWTVTQDSAVELRWTAGNVEEDLNGYYVFYTEAKNIADSTGILAAVKPTYPAGVNIGLSGIPRCVGNTKFFEAFKFPATDKECEDDTATSTATGTTLSLTDSAMLADSTGSDTGTTTSDEPKLTGFAKCEAGSSADVSLTAVPPVVAPQKCRITGLTNGTTYAFFVMAVRDEFTKVSWTSNVLTDTPSADALKDGTLKLNNGKYVAIEIDPATAKATVADAADCTGDFADLCGKISLNNGANPTKPTVYLSRAAATGAGSSLQRLYVSAAADAPDTAKVLIQPRGPQTWDPLAKATATRIPGDEAASEYPTTPGTKYVVYNNQVFDLQITTAAGNNFGKLIVSDVTYADATTAGATNTSEATLSVAVVMQPQVGSHDYFTTAQFIY